MPTEVTSRREPSKTGSERIGLHVEHRQVVLGEDARLTDAVDLRHDVLIVEALPFAVFVEGDSRDIGQPVLVPGSMGTASWVLVGTEGSMERSLGSTCHGAGRRMSRRKAKRSIHGSSLRDELESRGIRVRAGSMPKVSPK